MGHSASRFKKPPDDIFPSGQIFNLLIVLQLFPLFNLYCPQFFRNLRKYYRQSPYAPQALFRRRGGMGG